MSANQRVKEVRQALGLSQAKFAKQIAVSNGYFAGIELAQRKVNERLIKLIGAEFNVNETWLRTGEGEMFNSAPDGLLDEVIKVFRQLRPEYQDYVLKQVRQLLEMQNARNNGI